MPRMSFLQKSLRSVCIDTVLFFAMFALIGHITINFWERYTIQNELSTMKHSLHTLKDTISHIGKAYDNLHTELKDLFNMVDEKPMKTLEHKEQDALKCKNKYTIDRKTLHDLEVQTALTNENKKNKVGIGGVTNKIIEQPSRENKATEPLGKNVSTNTKNPPKSTGITSDMSRYEKEQYLKNVPRRIHSYNNHLRCYKDFEHCKHVCHDQHLNDRN